MKKMLVSGLAALAAALGIGCAASGQAYHDAHARGLNHVVVEARGGHGGGSGGGGSSRGGGSGGGGGGHHGGGYVPNEPRLPNGQWDCSWGGYCR